MPIESLTIEGAGGIERLELKLDPSMNILCGPNGIGKTTILECISHSFGARHSTTLHRHAKFPKGLVVLDGTAGGTAIMSKLYLNHFEPDHAEHLAGRHILAHWLLYLKTSRDIDYRKLTAISTDPTIESSRQSSYSQPGVTLEGVKNWFIQRFMFSAHKNVLQPPLLENFKLAKKTLSRLEKGFKFSTVDAKRSEIMIQTPTGIVPFEYLSAGFRSCISLVFGIIKEIEYRFIPEEALAAEFDGIVLIDEIELHLHPEWQKGICGLLSRSFPKAQFIVTTHSPHVLQTARTNSIVSLRSKGDGGIEKANLANTEHGFHGWTLEEILTDVMGMRSTISRQLQRALLKFSAANEAHDADAMATAYRQLDGMLHPASTVRKILAIQLEDRKAQDD